MDLLRALVFTLTATGCACFAAGISAFLLAQIIAGGILIGTSLGCLGMAFLLALGDL